jgi:hypothetical protein
MTNMPSAPDSPTVFVVHGHNLAARDVLVQFIRATGVRPKSFSDVVRGKAGTASILEIVESGLRGLSRVKTPSLYCSPQMITPYQAWAAALGPAGSLVKT